MLRAQSLVLGQSSVKLGASGTGGAVCGEAGKQLGPACGIPELPEQAGEEPPLCMLLRGQPLQKMGGAVKSGLLPVSGSKGHL